MTDTETIRIDPDCGLTSEQAALRTPAGTPSPSGKTGKEIVLTHCFTFFNLIFVVLAVRRGLALGYREFVLYGSLDGPRLDHTVANFQTLAFLADHGAYGYLVGRDTLVTVVKNGTITFPAGKDGTISVFCMGADAHGVTLEGLYYPLDNGVLTCGFPIGTSNHFTGKEAKITVKDGSLLIIWERKDGFPL